MWCRVSSGQVPITNDSARQRSSTASSATRRWPRTTRSSAHSLLPMPLSPTISTPSPRMSISTPCTTPRAAEVRVEGGREARHRFRASRPRVREQRHAGPIRLREGLRRRHEPAGDEQAREPVAEHALQDGRAVVRRQRFEIPHFALAEHEHAAAAQVRVESRQGQPGLLRVGNGDAPFEAGRAGEQLEIEGARIGEIPQDRGDGDTPRLGGFGHRSNAVRIADVATRPRPVIHVRAIGKIRSDRLVRLDQPEVAVLAAVQDVDGIRLRVAEDDERLRCRLRGGAPRLRATTA